MKTAISIPDPLFASAERMSRRLRISRSRLYALAVEEFVKSHERKGVKEALDEIYSSERSELDPVLAKMQVLSLPQEDW
jgi:metal-responsive CopG/Arc/MetJ family transcriptional regulator